MFNLVYHLSSRAIRASGKQVDKLLSNCCHLDNTRAMKVQLHHVLIIFATGCIGQATKASNETSSHLQDEWYSCPTYTPSNKTQSSDIDAECVTFAAPLCYPGICETPAHANSTIDVFVKRFPATTDPGQASNVWMLPGGPGSSSISCKYGFLLHHFNLFDTN